MNAGWFFFFWHALSFPPFFLFVEGIGVTYLDGSLDRKMGIYQRVVPGFLGLCIVYAPIREMFGVRF